MTGKVSVNSMWRQVGRKLTLAEKLEVTVLKDIALSSCQIQALSMDKHPTLKIHLDCGVDIMKFKSSQEEYEQFCNQNSILTAICRCNKNE